MDLPGSSIDAGELTMMLMFNGGGDFPPQLKFSWVGLERESNKLEQT